jgi:N-glycosylase/DNA lyase
MRRILQELEQLKESEISKKIASRMKDFEKVTVGGDAAVFSELCFCLMTANFQAEKSMKIQEALKKKFHSMSQEGLVKELRKHGHRFPNTRASFIFEARKHRRGIKAKLESFEEDDARREWVVKNVKGLGMKEASHFLRNIGYKNYAIIDFHIIDKLADSKIIDPPKNKSLTPKKYLEVESVLKKIGEKSGLNQGELDLYLWYSETGKILK